MVVNVSLGIIVPKGLGILGNAMEANSVMFQALVNQQATVVQAISVS